MEKQYFELVNYILESGNKVDSRNGKVISAFGPQHEFDLRCGFPLLTSKKMFIKGIIEELLFFLRGETQTKILEEKGVNIWKGNTSAEFLKSRNLSYNEGEMGPMYGFNLRNFGAPYNSQNSGFDQFKELINGIKQDPFSRRHLLTTFDPSRINECVLAPCHGIVIQFYVNSFSSFSSFSQDEKGCEKGCEKGYEKEILYCKMYQRSCDVALGYPFNIASYALLLAIVANMCDYIPGKLIITLGDVHIYEEHIEELKNQINREIYDPPQLKIKKKITLENLNDLTFNDFEVLNYKHHSPLKFIFKP